MRITKRIMLVAVVVMMTALMFAQTSGKSDDGKFSYKVENNAVTLSNNGFEKQLFEVWFYEVKDGNSDILGGYKRYIYPSEPVVIDVFDFCWTYLWRKHLKEPERCDISISIIGKESKESSNTFFFGINTKFVPNKKIFEEKKYKTAPATPKMTFKEEDAKTAVSKMKMGINLCSLAPAANELKNGDPTIPVTVWETAFHGEVITLEQVKHYKELGFTAVKLPVVWFSHMDENDNILENWFNRVQEVVDWCIQEDLYVILATYTDSDLELGWIKADEGYYNKYSSRYEKILTQVCERFKDYNEKLLFSNLNEPVATRNEFNNNYQEAKDLQVMNKWNQLFVDTVRRSGGNNMKRNLVIGALHNSWSSYILGSTKVPNDISKNHLIFDIHNYEPAFFVYPSEWTPVVVRTFEESKLTAKKIQSMFAPIKKFSKKNNIPVILGEWGFAENKLENEYVDDEEKAKYAELYVDEVMKLGFGMFHWSNCMYFGYTSINDAMLPSPLFLEAIRNTVEKY